MARRGSEEKEASIAEHIRNNDFQWSLTGYTRGGIPCDLAKEPEVRQKLDMGRAVNQSCLQYKAEVFLQSQQDLFNILD